MPNPAPQTSFSDIADIVSVRTNGQLPMIVGGHAVNVWAFAYLSRQGPRLQQHAPFVTKDLDLWGPMEILDNLAQKYGVPIQHSQPRGPGLGRIDIPKGHVSVRVELLTNVHGLRKLEEKNAVHLVVQGTEIRVLDAISCLRAKIANAADIDQSQRQDVKHVQIMKICAREFAKDLLEKAQAGRASERIVVNYLEDLRKTLAGPKAQTVTRKWGISFDDVMPLESIRESALEKVKNFARHRLE